MSPPFPVQMADEGTVADAPTREPVGGGSDGQRVVLDAAVESRLQYLCKLGLMICRCRRH